MRNERKYRVLLFLTTIVSVLLLSNCVREYWRMEAATERQRNEYIAMGAKIYAENCVTCHGPAGEGSVGMPLNRVDIRVDHTTTSGKQVYDVLYDAIANGRKGNVVPTWEVAQDGKFRSYTAMPQWHKDKGGPLDNHKIRGVVLFLMEGDWNTIGSVAAPIPDPNLDPDVALPDTGHPDDPKAHALLNNIGKSLCLTCHAIGSKGGHVGPDLSKIGAWGISEEFLKDWIRNANGPNAMPHDVRMPVYWSNTRATIGPETLYGDEYKILSEGPYKMPAFDENRLTDEELDLLVKYLLRLK